MPEILFLPENKKVTAREGDSILDAATRNGVHLEHNCGGVCACATCHVIITEGFDNLSPMEEDEEDQIEEAEGLTLKSRLACQAKVTGDLVVTIPFCSKGGHEH
ncbi:MAG: 2Fe-2S iron-sulfur cluster-binding protein [Leptospirillum sp.]|nr:2Fe-2S iron-sulfur cluster-binding protein [Nitrospiraceae bacterium]MDA8149529.1 2Fe-2S iron-sulfur cluster-binding protein [Nitrospiraceae bacterium]